MYLKTWVYLSCIYAWNFYVFINKLLIRKKQLGEHLQIFYVTVFILFSKNITIIYCYSVD